MKVLYSTQSVVEFDGKHYYNNAVNATYPRYLALGDEITVLTHSKKVNKPQSNMIADNAVRFVFIPKINSLKSLLYDSRKVRKILEEEVKNTDVCVVHMNGHGRDIVKLANKYKKPLMSVVGGCAWDALWNYDWRGKILAPWAYIQTKIAQKKVEYTIYVTKKFLQSRYPNCGKWVACSNVNIKTGVSGILEQRLTRIDKVEKQKTILRIGTSAALDVPYKGQKYVIRALDLLRKQGICLEYHLIGRGDASLLKSEVERLHLNDQVFIHGPLPHNEVLGFLDDIDIYVQPSKQEGLPRAMIEAMSRGCLCLGSNIAGIPELVENKYLFAKGSVKQIASILSSITYDDLRAQAIANYEKAKDYDKDVLDERRRNFILEFKNSYNK